MKKVLYISYDGMTDVLGQSQVLPYLTGLSKSGFGITILSFEKKERYNKERAVVEQITEAAGIRWAPLFYTRTPPVLSKIYDRWQMRRQGVALHRETGFDMVHCRSYVAAETGLYLKQRFGVKFLFDMRGFWADERVDNGQWNLQSILYRRLFAYYKRKERAFLLEADAIVSLTQAGKRELLGNPAYADLPIDVIPCCADLEHFDYHKVSGETTRRRRQELALGEGQKVMTYLGSVGGWYMTAEMFAFYRRLLQVAPEFVLLFITKDPADVVRTEAQTAGIGPDQIRVVYSTRADLPQYLSVSDLSLFFIRPTYSKIASSPTKHAELMGMGIPVVCNDIGDTGGVIGDTGTGLLVREFSSDEYDRVAGTVKAFLRTDREHIRRSAFAYFDLAVGIERYFGIYQRLLT